MGLPHSEVTYTVEEYLALERASEERHEYLDGQIYAMSGESPAHGDICSNLTFQLVGQLRGGPCRAWSKDTKVRSGPAPKSRQDSRGFFSYPDLVVVCGEPQFHDEHRDVLLNPSIIIEVLSPSTGDFDRGRKWSRYQTWLSSLAEFVLVSQIEPRLERYRRQPNGEWLYSSVSGLEGSLHLASINCTLRLTEVYDRVVFSVEATPDSSDPVEGLPSR